MSDGFFNVAVPTNLSELVDDITNAVESEVLTKTNITEFTPTSNYHPSTKKYVDDNIPTVPTKVSDLENDSNFIANLSEDTSPELGGELDCGEHSIVFADKDNGNSSGYKEIDWSKSNTQKIILTDTPVVLKFLPPSDACGLTLKCIQDGTGSRILSEIITSDDMDFETTDVDTTENTIVVGENIPTGTRIRIGSDNTVPAGIVSGTTYWAININATTIKVAESYANAIAGTAIDITDQGTGTHFVMRLAKWAGGTLPTLSTDAGAIDFLSFRYDGYDFYGMASLAFS